MASTKLTKLVPSALPEGFGPGFVAWAFANGVKTRDDVDRIAAIDAFVRAMDDLRKKRNDEMIQFKKDWDAAKKNVTADVLKAIDNETHRGEYATVAVVNRKGSTGIEDQELALNYFQDILGLAIDEMEEMEYVTVTVKLTAMGKKLAIHHAIAEEVNTGKLPAGFSDSSPTKTVSYTVKNEAQREKTLEAVEAALDSYFNASSDELEIDLDDEAYDSFQRALSLD